ncbi:MAG: hypothetical protein HYR94_27420 [Chloroflexi bacterium]|nr:hypothetical protein [Chloroflexota bacterium]
MSPSRNFNWFSLCFSFSILFYLLTGCGGKNDFPPRPTDTPVAAAPTEALATAVPTVAAEPTEAKPTEAVAETTAEGEFDARTLPRFADAEIIYEDKAQLIYITPADVAAVADFSRQELAALGWQEYQPPFAQVTDDPNLKPLTFKKDGQGLSAFITVAPTQDNKTSVQYSPIPLEADLPALADAAGMEFSDKQLYLGYTTASDFDAVIAFYREQLAAPEWQEAADMTIVEPEQGRLVFANQGKEMALVLDLTPAGDGRTKVTLQPLTEEALAAATEEASAEATEEAAVSPAGMPDLPTPTDAQNVNYDAESGEMNFTSPSKIDQLVEFYRQELPAQGWQEDEESAFIQEDAFASLEFTQGEASLSLSIFQLGEETDVTISLSGLEASAAGGDSGETGADSSDTGSTDTELTAEDKDGLPVPSNYTNYSSEGSQFSRTVIVTVPADLTSVLEFYRRELPAQGWQEQADAAQVETSTAVLMFTGDKGDLTLKLSQTAAETEVKLAHKDTAAAKEAGVLPPAGQARLYFGNMTEAQVTFSINQQELKVDPQDPGQDSMEGVPNLDLPPGKYEYTLTLPGQPAISEEIEVGANETWGLIAGPGGALPLQLY